jgi:transglutaminase-like putative cysteine protease
MPRQLKVRHVTEYHYSEPVSFGQHRMMFRPRDSHSLRLLRTHLSISPRAESIRWIYDVFGNSVAFAEFGDVKSDTLTFVSEIEVLHYESPHVTSLLLASAERLPISYAPSEIPDLSPTMMQHCPDPDGAVASWAKDIAVQAEYQTVDVLTGMMAAIGGSLVYQTRYEAGTQEAADTLRLGTGTCRDFALLMMEGLRSYGMAARFVSGYLYKANRVRRRGFGSAHAWVQVYLPGCGWMEMDPTNGIMGNRDLIRIAVARDHNQSLPLSGTFTGAPSAYRGMTVTVDVTERDADTA